MKKWNDLAIALKNEPMILGNRITGKSLHNCFLEGMAIKKEKNGKIIAFGALWPTNDKNFLEVGSFWVNPFWRGQKLCTKILNRISVIPIKDKTVFVISHNKKIVHLLRNNNWQEVSAENWTDLIPFVASCGPCDEFSENEKRNCPNMAKEGKCLMFILKD